MESEANHFLEAATYQVVQYSFSVTKYYVPHLEQNEEYDGAVPNSVPVCYMCMAFQFVEGMLMPEHRIYLKMSAVQSQNCYLLVLGSHCLENVSIFHNSQIIVSVHKCLCLWIVSY